MEVHLDVSSPAGAIPLLAVFRAGASFAPARLPPSCRAAAPFRVPLPASAAAGNSLGLRSCSERVCGVLRRAPPA
eukprot:3286271-Alexandrium_andersonii.AAC.1